MTLTAWLLIVFVLGLVAGGTLTAWALLYRAMIKATELQAQLAARAERERQ